MKRKLIQKLNEGDEFPLGWSYAYYPGYWLAIYFRGQDQYLYKIKIYLGFPWRISIRSRRLFRYIPNLQR